MAPVTRRLEAHVILTEIPGFVLVPLLQPIGGMEVES